MNLTTQIKDELIKEVGSLKTNATPRELNNLKVNTFDAKTSEGNIYGQITGDNNLTRMKELLNKGAVPYSQKLNQHIPVEPNATFENRTENRSSNENNIYSVLEFVLYNEPELWENVIDYLISATPTLEFVQLEHKS